jgi:signal transduction histidine kinase
MRTMEVAPLSSPWPLSTKLKFGLALWLANFAVLFVSAQYGLYAYRGLVRTLSARSAELPLANSVSQNVSDLRVVLCRVNEHVDLGTGSLSLMRSRPEDPVYDTLDTAQHQRDKYLEKLNDVIDAVRAYHAQLEANQLESDARLGDSRYERAKLDKINEVLENMSLESLNRVHGRDWFFAKDTAIELLRAEADKLFALAAELPSQLHERLQALAVDVRARYRTAIVLAWTSAFVAFGLLAVSVRLFYAWFARPLSRLVEASRQVASGNFAHRIQVDSADELGELAQAMNAMTARFCEIRDDLDRQVRERTRQVVRSEQLASVGFLAAGVSHEINNPLASIAMCSESLESRLEELLETAGPTHAAEVEVVKSYLQMIQREAFRCKQITERLLDFARRGDSQRHRVDMRELVKGVLEMVQHLGRSHDARLALEPGDPVLAEVNPQEMKQVVLNLVTNALESLDDQGWVRVQVERRGTLARIVVADNGCGMNEEVQRHLFEPFYTRRRSGQGTGLGLSITHRIVEEHGGAITAASAGVGQGSEFVVTLPIEAAGKEESHRYQAA